jgi:hypothetical protein
VRSVLIPLLALLAGSTTVLAEEIPENVRKPCQLLVSKSEPVKRCSLRAQHSHSDFTPSLDGRSLIFSENGRMGQVLKRVSLANGSVATVFRTLHEIDSVTVVPRNPNHLVLSWKAGLGGSPPYEISIVDLAQEREWPVDVGSTYSDGQLLVSPSGRFLAVGTGLVPFCKPWLASEVAVFSVATGARELTYKLPLAAGSPSRENLDASQICSNGPILGWTASDDLVIWNWVDIAFQRTAQGWKRTSTRQTVEPRMAPPRIQFLEPGDLEREFGCVGVPVGSSDAVMGWSYALVVMKIDGVVLRFVPGNPSGFTRGGDRLGDRMRQHWISGPASAFLDLIRTRDCASGDDCDGSHWEGDLTVWKRNGTDVGSPKALRIRIECGC